MTSKNIFSGRIRSALVLAAALAGVVSLAGCGATLFSASCDGEQAAVRSLLDRGAPLNKGRELWCASAHGHREIVLLLLEKGADPNLIFPDHENEIALIAAIAADRNQVARELIKHGAKVNVADLDGKTPLAMSAIRGNQEMMLELISHGANLDAACKALDTFSEENSYSNVLAQKAKSNLKTLQQQMMVSPVNKPQSTTAGATAVSAIQ